MPGRTGFRRIAAAALLAGVGFAGYAHRCVADPIHVSPTGNDNDPGTPTQPVQTIGRALSIASQFPGPIHVAQGTYLESIYLSFESGMSIFGGFDPTSGWTRDPSLHPTVVVSPGYVVAASGVQNLVLDGLVIRSEGAFDLGGSSVGIFLASCSNILIVGCRVEAGSGQDGVPGDHGPPGQSGSSGQWGQSGCENSTPVPLCTTCSRPQGGAGGFSSWGRPGGSGGNAGHAGASGSPGGAGSGPGPGAGGSGTPPHLGDWNPSASYVGKPGSPGANGADGTGGFGAGGGDMNGYVPASGTPGSPGEHGSGGGGGGGGGGGETSCDSYGSGGGGGGEGGERGSGGEGGGGGGGSIAVLLVQCEGVSVRACTLVTSAGGAGAGAGGGGAGGAGGSGARVNLTNVGGPYGGPGDQDDGSNGARGGTGGRGGDGGRGGGGGGGPSIAIFNASATPVMVADNVYLLGEPGPGSEDDIPGQPGVAAEVHGPSSTLDVEHGPLLPATNELGPGVPNPFARDTRIDFALATAGRVTLSVHDLRGALVATLAEGEIPAGRHSFRWDGRVVGGGSAGPGVYFVRMSVSAAAGSESRIRKIVRMN